MELLYWIGGLYFGALLIFGVAARLYVTLVLPFQNIQISDILLGLFGMKRIDISRCQRCGMNHYDIVVTPLSNAVDNYNWFATCPNKKEPVLVTYNLDKSV